MMTRKTVSEISLLPENSDPITTVQSTIAVNSRRRKTLALEGRCAGATGVSGIRGKATNPEFRWQLPFAYRSIINGPRDLIAIDIQYWILFSFKICHAKP